MRITLDEGEVRVLGCLIEKEVTTPDYYPMTLNALTNACNQKSNRQPVVSFKEERVVRALDGLQEKGLSLKVHEAGSRVPKYRHDFREAFDFSDGETAILCVLMLRGPQTGGEIRVRTERLHTFRNLEEVEETLQRLMAGDEPNVVKLPRQPGRKEPRYMHLFSGTPQVSEETVSLPAEPATLRVAADNERIAQLETRVEALAKEMDALKASFAAFKKEFE
ncbi:MAG: YceH family protein [bacterium]|nr:YceH family protein [bacterium]